jgi:hypothetical protein
VQIHLIIPDAYRRPKGGSTLFGPGDTELGVKYRFIQESEYVPMMATFPLLELPTGSKARGLGIGRAQLYLPLWLQKSWGPWTSYGGGGYWINPGTGNKNHWYAGWLLQRNVFKWKATSISSKTYFGGNFERIPCTARLRSPEAASVEMLPILSDAVPRQINSFCSDL